MQQSDFFKSKDVSYEVLESLGKGYYAEVFLCKKNEKLYAVKKQKKNEDLNLEKRVYNEIIALKQI